MQKINNNLITFSTCWYILKSKFDNITYLQWIKNIVSIVNNFNLVIYTDTYSFKQLTSVINLSNKKIKIIIKPLENFYTYKYKNFWIKNHEKSNLDLHVNIDWELNMLWNEKVFFVKETIKNKYFDTFFYGWCDIGYFRNRENDLHIKHLLNWPHNKKLLVSPFNNINNRRIHYGCVENNMIKYNELLNDIKNHYTNKLITHPTSKLEEKCFAGGFFILKGHLIDSYSRLYEEKLMYYFMNNFTIKDDQTIIMDIIFSNSSMFCIHFEDNKYFDNWFMFQRLLL